LGRAESPKTKRISATEWDLYWQSEQYRGREELLPVLVELAKATRWRGDFENAWADWDVKLVGDCWHDILIRTATEELGWPNRFTRARCEARLTRFAGVSGAVAVVWSTLALLTGSLGGMLVGLGVACWVLWRIRRSRRCCLLAVSRLVAVAGDIARLQSACGGAGIEQRFGPAATARQRSRWSMSHVN
jgi:hypothetical protein